MSANSAAIIARKILRVKISVIRAKRAANTAWVSKKSNQY